MRQLKIVIVMLSIFTLAACSSMPRTKWTDKNMRVFVDPDSIDAENYVRIQQALVQSHKFVVIDRATSFEAIKKEQERLHRTQVDRFEDRQKFALYGKLLGVGAIVVAHAQCENKSSWWNSTNNHLVCQQFLSMVDANTGEVFLAVEGENSGPVIASMPYVVPDWKDTVEKLLDEYPKEFEQRSASKTLLEYEEVAKENAIRQKEIVNERKPAGE